MCYFNLPNDGVQRVDIIYPKIMNMETYEKKVPAMTNTTSKYFQE